MFNKPVQLTSTTYSSQGFSFLLLFILTCVDSFDTPSRLAPFNGSDLPNPQLHSKVTGQSDYVMNQPDFTIGDGPSTCQLPSWPSLQDSSGLPGSIRDLNLFYFQHDYGDRTAFTLLPTK